jgi:hypothetical protein
LPYAGGEAQSVLLSVMLSWIMMHAVQLGLAQAHQRDMAFLSALGGSFAPGELFITCSSTHKDA